MWPIKNLNLNLEVARAERKLQLNELEEIRVVAHKKSRMPKQRLKLFHDRHIPRKEIILGQKILVYDSRLHLLSSK